MAERDASSARRQIATAQQKGFGTASIDQSTHLFAREAAGGDQPAASEVAPRTWFVQPSLVNVAFFETDEGVLMVDCGCAGDGPALVEQLREVTAEPLHTVVYTHGHIDHAFGLWAFLDAGERPRVVAHENVARHFDRYMRTAGYNARINFQEPGDSGKPWPASSADFRWPDIEYHDTMELRIGGERFVLRHAKGETDDATWVWAPERRVIAAGDLVVGYLPNCGNPRKVQRYPEEWADAATEMASLGAEVLLTGHGAHLEGEEAIRSELLDLAAYLRVIVDHALEGLNAGRKPDHIVASLEIPEHLAANPRLQPNYDRPEFICRNVIRRYGGWWDAYPASLLPATQEERAAEIAALAGGVDVLVARARELVSSDLPLACHLAEWAFLAEPDHPATGDCVLEVFGARIEDEGSLMGKMAFAQAIFDVQAAGRAGGV